MSKRQHQRQLDRARARRRSDRFERRHRRTRIVALVAILSLVAGGGILLLVSALADGSPEVADEPPDEAAAGAEPCPPAEDVEPAPDERAGSYDAPPEQVIDEDATYVATIETTCGDLLAELDPAGAPIATNNFVVLARDGYYDGVAFHRVVPDFVVQAGDPTGTGTGGPGYTFEDELDTAQEHHQEVRDELAAEFESSGGDAAEPEQVPGGYPRGLVAMANSGPDTNGSQFFVTLGDPTLLEPNYTVFGEVIEGMDVADRISAGPLDGEEPADPVRIRSVTIDEG